MAKIVKLRGTLQEYTVAVGAYSRGGLLIICSSRVGTHSREGAFSRGANSRIYGKQCFDNRKTIFGHGVCL